MDNWDEIVKQYPNKWVFLKNVHRDKSGDIVSFELLKVCSKAEKPKWLKYYMNGTEKFECIRTTFNAPNVVLNNNIKEGDDC